MLACLENHFIPHWSWLVSLLNLWISFVQSDRVDDIQRRMPSVSLEHRPCREKVARAFVLPPFLEPWIPTCASPTSVRHRATPPRRNSLSSVFNEPSIFAHPSALVSSFPFSFFCPALVSGLALPCAPRFSSFILACVGMCFVRRASDRRATHFPSSFTAYRAPLRAFALI